ncbi:molybdopterin-guanine dinucleotide biosynthesis protein B [Bacillaceae bacterium W0354]
MLILQVVGYKNSGKTTLVNHIVQHFSKKSMSVATLKHHGHGGRTDMLQNTDTYKHEQAGANMTGVEGEGTLQLTINQEKWTIDQILNFYRLIKVDLLIIEGYKNLDFNKIVLIRSKDDQVLLDELSNVKLVVSKVKLDENENMFSVIQRKNINDILKWLENDLNHKLS